MQDKLENIARFAFNKWKGNMQENSNLHPSEETLACFLENKLNKEEADSVKEHISICSICSKIIALSLKIDEEVNVPAYLLMLAKSGSKNALEIVIKVKNRLLELIDTTGDVLLGEEFVPGPILRSRQEKDFKEEIFIIKDFQEARIEVKIENKATNVFLLIVLAKEKQTQKALSDLRITLIKDEVELESYHADSGKAVFENIGCGAYLIEFIDMTKKLALVDLKIEI